MALAPVPSMSPLVVLAHDDPGTADSLRHAVQTATGWQVVMADPSPAGLTAALATGPSVALVGCAALASLPADCRTPIVAIGDDDRAADVRAALAAGARSLLAWPDGVADLPGELARVALTGQPASTAGQPGAAAATPAWSSPPAASRAAPAPPPSPSTWPPPGPAGAPPRSSSSTSPEASRSASTSARSRPGPAFHAGRPGRRWTPLIRSRGRRRRSL